MLCRIFRCQKKSQTYVYMAINDEPSSLPEELRDSLGELEQVMLLDLGKRRRLAHAKPERVIKAIEESGFYLQLPPSPYPVDCTNSQKQID